MIAGNRDLRFALVNEDFCHALDCNPYSFYYHFGNELHVHWFLSICGYDGPKVGVDFRQDEKQGTRATFIRFLDASELGDPCCLAVIYFGVKHRWITLMYEYLGLNRISSARIDRGKFIYYREYESLDIDAFFQDIRIAARHLEQEGKIR